MKIHELKLDARFFPEVYYRQKNFEIRKNDRDYKVGDLLALSLYKDGQYLQTQPSPGDKVSNSGVDLHDAKTILREITYITDYAQKDGYVVMGIKPYI